MEKRRMRFDPGALLFNSKRRTLNIKAEAERGVRATRGSRGSALCAPPSAPHTFWHEAMKKIPFPSASTRSAALRKREWRKRP